MEDVDLFFYLFFEIGIHSMQGWTTLRGMDLQEKERQKD